MSLTPAKKATRPKKQPETKGELTTTPKPKKAKPAAGAPEASTAKAPKAERPPAPKGPKYPGPVVRLLLPMAAYSEHKEAIKAALKEEGLGFQHLGRGQGRYFNDKVSVFAKWGDRDADYTVRGDAAVVEKLAATLKRVGATDYTEETKAEEEAENVKAWKLEKPAPRPGEPEFFYKKRLAEWEARDPRRAG